MRKCFVFAQVFAELFRVSRDYVAIRADKLSNHIITFKLSLNERRKNVHCFRGNKITSERA
nr:MAG: hypothetical protein [Bacteriophage sp.]